MIGRRQLPVASPVALSSVIGATWPLLTGSSRGRRALTSTLRKMFGARSVVLTDSGTSALVLALRIAAGEGKTVAYPGYACLDLAAAARFARVRVRLYDVDPHTLSPDLDSLAATIARGVDAIVVVHLYGLPVDMPAVSALARQHGIPVIEDAAQAAGGSIGDRLLGSFGALSTLSFGRGKGITGGHGGALLCHDATLDQPTTHAARLLGSSPRGLADVLAAGAQWALGRPALYGIPSAIPGLRLGEMVYRPAHEPGALSAAAASLVRRALRAADREIAIRRRNASIFMTAVAEGADITAITPPAGADGRPGYLRFPVRDANGRQERHDIGIWRGYPRTLHEQAELGQCLMNGEPATPGAAQLRQSLFALPTHNMVRRSDIDQLVAWLRVPTGLLVPIRRPNDSTAPPPHVDPARVREGMGRVHSP